MRAYIRPAEFLLYVGACKNDIQQKSAPHPALLGGEVPPDIELGLAFVAAACFS